jgi:hypothetical protein
MVVDAREFCDLCLELGRAVLIFACALHKKFSARDLAKKKNIARISATAQFKARLHPVASLHHN